VGSIVLVTLLYFSYPTVGQETASTNEKSEAVQDVELEAVDSKPATTIDFAGELGADFPSLLTLGSRIDVAKRDNDPVTLALLGQELKAAETVSGKTASLSSTKIFDDAAKLAIERAHTNELKAVKFLIPDKAADLDKAIVLASEDDVTRGPNDRIIKQSNGELKSVNGNAHAAGWYKIHANGSVDIYHWTKMHVSGTASSMFLLCVVDNRSNRVKPLWETHHHYSVGAGFLSSRYKSMTETRVMPRDVVDKIARGQAIVLFTVTSDGSTGVGQVTGQLKQMGGNVNVEDVAKWLAVVVAAM
jgi:hypothetical protein